MLIFSSHPSDLLLGLEQFFLATPGVATDLLLLTSKVGWEQCNDESIFVCHEENHKHHASCVTSTGPGVLFWGRWTVFLLAGFDQDSGPKFVWQV